MSTPDLPTNFGPLRDQLLGAAEAFSSDAQPLSDILSGLVNDVERATAEPLEIMPVCHHSPSSAVHMVRRLQQKAPRVIYMECCEDMRPLLDGLYECKLPVALQAFASGSDSFPSSWSPLSLVCPLTEFSAEFQAIAFALTNPSTELVFVDRSADHVFQWMPQEDEAIDELLPDQTDDDDDESGKGIHGSSVGLEMGSLVPTFGEFSSFLTRNARVSHYTEWWDQYVEDPIMGADFGTYRQVMFLVGSLIRSLGTHSDNNREDELRERYMWTRMKQHLAKNSIDPTDAIYICGAAHAASQVEEFGAASDVLWDIPPRTDTKWLYGLLPSSYAAIEHQFGHPPGAVSMAEGRWRKQLKRDKNRPFSLSKTPPKRKASPPPPIPVDEDVHPLMSFLQKPPELVSEDEEELLQHSVRIVAMARKNGYMSSTADSIAIYQTAILLANMRNRKHPTPYDFRDAAVTCLEKDSVPKKRNIARICDIMLGGDKIGKIGYESMPPLAKNVYDRLGCLPCHLEARTIQRTLLDFKKHPGWLPASDLLWQLRYLLKDVVRPIIGQRELGATEPIQESWDIAIGKNQGAVIQLGYEGVTIEHVLERRLKKQAFAPDARTIDALKAAEDCILYLKSERLTQELGERAVRLLINEPDVQDAQEIYSRISKLIHYYRSSGGLPTWCGDFVTSGYSHYCTLLPEAFAERSVTPEQLAAMLQFILTLESLALSLGCERSQLVIAIKQAAGETTDPAKLGLLWSVECVLQLKDVSELRTRFDNMLAHQLGLHALPEYLAGFLLALSFTPILAGFTVELMSKAFAQLPDEILMPWLPGLLRSLRDHQQGTLGTLLKEAGSVFPQSLDALQTWSAPWDKPTEEGNKVSSGAVTANNGLSILRAFPEATEAIASSLGYEAEWQEVPIANEVPEQRDLAISDLLSRFPDSVKALSRELN